MAVACTAIKFYDPRLTVKAVAAEVIAVGESCYISSDGLVYVVDNGKNDVCHGWAIHARIAGQMTTLATQLRMDVDATQTPGALVYTGQVAGGSAPSTTLGAGLVVGFAVSANLIYCTIITPPGAAG